MEPHNEYNQVICLTTSVKTQPGLVFVDAAVASTPLSQSCRELTLARGRILYEVASESESRIVGWIVPYEVNRFAIQYRHGLNAESCWEELSRSQQAMRKQALAFAKKEYPRMTPLVALRFADYATSKGWNGDSGIEELVVSYVRDEWSSYQLSLSQTGFHTAAPERDIPNPPIFFNMKSQQPTEGHQSGITSRDDKEKMQIASYEAVKPRMREVLQSWLPSNTTTADLAHLYRLHDLNGGEGGGAALERGHVTLTHFFGAETVANLTYKPLSES